MTTVSPTQAQRGQLAGLLGHAQRRLGLALGNTHLGGAGFVHGRETDTGLLARLNGREREGESIAFGLDSWDGAAWSSAVGQCLIPLPPPSALQGK